MFGKFKMAGIFHAAALQVNETFIWVEGLLKDIQNELDYPKPL